MLVSSNQNLKDKNKPMSDTKHNPKISQLFKLRPVEDTSQHAPLVHNTREVLHPQQAIADDESDDDNSDE